jgi:hypothetical protein
MSDETKKDNNFINQTYNDPFDSVAMNPHAINSFISGLGVRFMHFQAVQDPLYKSSESDPRHSFNQQDNYMFENSNVFTRENGFLYFPKKVVLGIFMNNSKNLRNIDPGLYSDSGATVSFNRFYEGTDEVVEFSEYDKLVPCECPTEFFTTSLQEFEHNPTGIDRLQFPAEAVRILIDSDRKTYQQNVDFQLISGQVKWNEGKAPGYNKTTGKGKVCSIRYTYRPYMYIKMVLHDIRVRPEISDISTGETKTTASGMLCQLQRDFIFLDKRNADDTDIQSQLNAMDTQNTGPR